MPQLVIADPKGKILVHPHLKATGMKGSGVFTLRGDDLVKLPAGSRLFMLPQRLPIGYDPRSKDFVVLATNPFSKKLQRCFAVAAFTSPGFTATYHSAYHETGNPKALPLFSYAAAAFHKGSFYAAAVRVDNDPRHDSHLINMEAVRKNIAKFKILFPENRLVPHLATCASVHGCPNAQNFFLGRYEAPLPTSPACNARCAGCISFQPEHICSVTQPRITFVPTPEELCEIAVFHIARVKDPIVSFGQGCEGEPLLKGGIIEKAILLIRRKTPNGTININTNASRPETVARLFDAGLDSIRVSLNSCRAPYYERYYRPRGYTFTDVMKSIRVAGRKDGFVSINYLTMPGFTDSKEEYASLRKLLGRYPVDMIQWRNLNFDPHLYFRTLNVQPPPREMAGIKELIDALKKEFPKLMMGYFNPSKSKIVVSRKL